MPDFRPNELVMYERAVAAVRKLETVNVIALQNAMAAASHNEEKKTTGGTVSYNGAVEFLARMEDDGIVGPMSEAGVRQVLPVPT